MYIKVNFSINIIIHILMITKKCTKENSGKNSCAVLYKGDMKSSHPNFNVLPCNF